MLKGFKDFLMRGNVLELAVAVVIGTAFTALVTAFTENLINPVIAALGGSNVNGLGFQLVDGNPKTVLDLGAVLSAVINFLIIAAVVYFLFVLPFQTLQARRKRGEETGPAVAEIGPSSIDRTVHLRGSPVGPSHAQSLADRFFEIGRIGIATDSGPEQSSPARNSSRADGDSIGQHPRPSRLDGRLPSCVSHLPQRDIVHPELLTG